MNMLDTLKGSYFSQILPEGWDIAKIMECVSNDPATVCDRQDFWNPEFNPIKCGNLNEFETYMGHEIAMQIRLAKERNEKIGNLKQFHETDKNT